MNNYKEVFELAQQKGYILNFTMRDDWEFVEACTIQKWLRDEHQINIIITPNHNKYDCQIEEYELLITNRHGAEQWEPHYEKTYEDALCQALAAALKLLL